MPPSDAVSEAAPQGPQSPPAPSPNPDFDPALMRACRLCPRNCGTDRTISRGRCRSGAALKIARAALHHWEEPCISGKRGSGAVFFCGCALGCVFCQNQEISSGSSGTEISSIRLLDIFFELREAGAHNINLVTADHYIPQLVPVMERAKNEGLNLPFVFNCSGYETIEQLKPLEGLVDVYLPDFKYMDPILSSDLSSAADYPETAASAVSEMVRQKGSCVFDEDGMLLSGVMVRHLVLPGHISDSRHILKYLRDTFQDRIIISLLRQYTPPSPTAVFLKSHPELKRRLRREEYRKAVDYALSLGIENAYIQERGSADEIFIPDFDGTGVSRQPAGNRSGVSQAPSAASTSDSPRW